LIDALIECLSAGPIEEETQAASRHQTILARFEDLLEPGPILSIADICAALGVSERTLRECCNQHLDMAPSRYRRLRRMQQVHRALSSETPVALSVSKIAGRHGIHDLGRFAATYRAIYGESPSATLRRCDRGTRRRVKGPCKD
jgi:AraC-like DNA-binding protein